MAGTLRTTPHDGDLQSTTDPIDDVREGWDNHVAFGLEFPSAYGHIYGNVRPGVPCRVAEDGRRVPSPRLSAVTR
jgi:hypothetical protein